MILGKPTALVIPRHTTSGPTQLGDLGEDVGPSELSSLPSGLSAAEDTRRFRTKGCGWKGSRPGLRRQGKRAMALTEAEGPSGLRLNTAPHRATVAHRGMRVSFGDPHSFNGVMRGRIDTVGYAA